MSEAITVFVSTANEAMPYAHFVEKLFKPLDSEAMELLHAAVGVGGEAGELQDALKKIAIYNKPVDLKNIVEELGDLRFYMQAIMNHFDIEEDEVLQSNVRKLEARYPTGKYSDKDAIERKDKTPALDNVENQV